MAKVTFTSVYNAVSEILSNHDVEETVGEITIGDVRDWFNKEMGKATRRNVKAKERNATKAAEANAPIMEAITSALAASDKKMTCKDMIASIPELAEVSSHKVSAVLRKMPNVVATKVKGINAYSLAADSE